MSGSTERPAAANRLRFFDYDSAPTIERSALAHAPSGSNATMEAYGRLAELGSATGLETRVLFQRAEPEPLTLIHTYFKPGRIVPRHSHDVDCLYVVTNGELRMGSRHVRSGDGLFVPAGQPYGFEVGPEGAEVLEYRQACSFHQQVRDHPPEQWEAIAQRTIERRDGWADDVVPPSRRG